MLRQDDYIKSHLLTIGYSQGKEYGGHLAASMVMSTIANRVRRGWGNWTEVLNNIPKYSAVDIIEKSLPSLWDQNFIKLLTEVEGIYDGSMKDQSCGALYWCDTRNITRPWFLKEIVRSGNYEACSNMNSLTFYRPSETIGAVEHHKIYGRD